MYGLRTTMVLDQVGDERGRQNERFGPQDRMKDGTGPHFAYRYEAMLANSRHENDYDGGTWAAVLCEEFCEAMLEKDPEKLRAELIQVAAVAVKWVEAIDRRYA